MPDSSQYCKLGYFRWGKISPKCWQDVSRGGNFHDTTPISFLKVYGFYFCVGVIFAKKAKARKTRKITLHENFHVYSIWLNGGLVIWSLIILLWIFLQGPGCRFNDRVKKIIPSQQHLKDLGLYEAWDIEDLGLLGKKHKVFMLS